MPRDNPFVNRPGARPEVWAYGLRKPWRMGFDRQTGELYVGDVGYTAWPSLFPSAPVPEPLRCLRKFTRVAGTAEPPSVPLGVNEFDRGENR